MLFSSDGKADKAVQTAYDFTFARLTGSEQIALADFAGKVLLIVNTASRCGFTGQYEGLEKIYQTYSSRNLVVLGVPSDDFGHQEPGSDVEIADFCQMNYGVTFPMTSKTKVIGDKAHPFYKWAREQVGLIGAPKWNFHKYLIGADGRLITYFHSTTGPQDKALVSAIEAALSEVIV